jgi:ppGpp synthetase/RelA/SpoT-type nucleotidyltranferase
MADAEFEQNLKNLSRMFQDRQDTMVRYTENVVNTCDASLKAGNVRHTPITWRIKKWESAEGSIRRRQQERVTRRLLRNAVEKHRSWQQYCRDSGLEAHEDETGPFRRPEEMLAALHDFGGVRISLYFPGDVERVSTILHDRFHVVRVTRKGQDMGNVRKLQERLEDFKAEEANPTKHHNRFQRTFAGYKATHFVVMLKELEIPRDRKESWRDIMVEIQVGTLVMHVWSEIEHDMIYKQLELQGQRISDDEERVLDLINGIVMTGEAALRQLEVSTARRLDQRSKDTEALASSHFELATWIDKHFSEKKIQLVQGEWDNLEPLFAILKVAGDHKHSIVKSLLDSKAVGNSPSHEMLPTVILGVLCSRCPNPQNPTFLDLSIATIFRNAQFWALRLVHSLNLAIYLGVGDEFVNSTRNRSRPSLVAFLDILHPNNPSYPMIQNAEEIANYCKEIITKPPKNRLVRVASDLPRTGRVVGTPKFEGSRTILVPGIITKLFSIKQLSSPNPGHSGVDESEPWRILDFIDFYLGHDDDNKLVFWDRLFSPGEQEHKRPIDQRFFVSRPHGENVGLWRLVDHHVPLDIVNLDLYKAELPATSIQQQKLVPTGDGGNSDDVLELAYRLHPTSSWDRAQKARIMARLMQKALRDTNRLSNPPRSGSSETTKRASYSIASYEKQPRSRSHSARDLPRPASRLRRAGTPINARLTVHPFPLRPPTPRPQPLLTDYSYI